MVGRKPASLSSVSDGMAPKGIHQSVAVSVIFHGIGCALLQHSPKGSYEVVQMRWSDRDLPTDHRQGAVGVPSLQAGRDNSLTTCG